MRKIRILHIIHGLNIGGAENFIFNIMRLLDCKKFVFDFAIQNPNIGHTLFEKEIYNRGGEIYLITDFRKNIFRHKVDINKVISKGYDYIHVHMNAIINPIPLIVASKYDCKIIVHSHNTSSAGGVFGNLLHKLNRKLFIKDKYIRVACGTVAGKWMFGNNPFHILNNAVDLQSYRFNTKNRQSIREKYKISDEEFVIGHVGRVIPIKNQEFSIKLINKITKKYPALKFCLMVVGDGKDILRIKKLAEEYQVSDKVIFTGFVNNTQIYYSSFDCLILPSLFEGFAFVAVEAQAAGLKVIASDCNTKDINITEEVSFKSLDRSTEWVDSVVSCATPYDRDKVSAKLIGTMFDSCKLRSVIENLYEI